MVQLEELHYCSNCDAEFSVYPNFEAEELISFCPYCGSELDYDDSDEEDDDYMQEDEDIFDEKDNYDEQ